jgi:osmotically-inducible protein OsmY
MTNRLHGTLGALSIAAVLLAAAALPACASTRTRESTGQYVDDSALTAKVKSAIVADPELRTLDVHVTTFKGVVELSGFVDSKNVSRRAEEVAEKVDGVKKVKNDLSVKPG